MSGTKSNKKSKFERGQQVVACPKTLSDEDRRGKLMARTNLSSDELRHPMAIIKVENGQLTLKHPMIATPFIVHQKFFKHASEHAS